MIARYTLSLGPALFVTLGLVLLMQLMIATGRPAATDGLVHRIVEFVRVERTPVLETGRERPEPPPAPTDRPQPSEHVIDEYGPVVHIGEPARPEVGVRGKVEFALADGDVLALTRVAPQYPAAAIRQGLEGFVVVELTVLRTGAVADVVVVESTHSVFERAAIEAAGKFRYKPRVVDGETVAVTGVRTKLTFELGEG
jgi:protein TonB